MSFHDDLQVGEGAEKRFIALLKTKGLKGVKNQSKTLKGMQGYDIRIVGSKETFEIKKDRKFAETGNVYLEHKAILHSNAKSIVYELEENCFYWAPLPRLITLLTDDNNGFKQVKGGDFRSSGTLIPVAKFKEIFNEYR